MKGQLFGINKFGVVGAGLIGLMLGLLNVFGESSGDLIFVGIVFMLYGLVFL